MPARVAALLSMTLLLCGCGARAAEVVVADAWARATPPGATVGAVFMRLTSPRDDQLIAISTPRATRVEMHAMTQNAGRVSMRPMAELELPAGQTVDLAPTGTHLMLLGLKGSLKANTRFDLELTFRHGRKQRVSVAVVAPDAR